MITVSPQMVYVKKKNQMSAGPKEPLSPRISVLKNDLVSHKLEINPSHNPCITQMGSIHLALIVLFPVPAKESMGLGTSPEQGAPSVPWVLCSHSSLLEEKGKHRARG